MKIISFFCLIIQLFRQDNKQHYEQSLQHRTTKWSIKDSILWESKVLPDAILQLHANYAFKTDNPKIGHIKNATTLLLINGKKTEVVWDTSFIKDKYFSPQFVAYLQPTKDVLAITDKELTFIVGNSDTQGYLISTAYNHITQKWGLVGYHRHLLHSFSRRHLLGINTMLLHDQRQGKVPQIFRINQYGEIEIYDLKSVEERVKSVPLPGIPYLEETEDSRKTVKESYYQYLEKIPEKTNKTPKYPWD